MRIAYLGLGVMGLPFAGHLASAGHPVVGWDLDPRARQRAAEAGIAVADGFEAALADAQILFTCLPSEAAAEAVFGELTGDGLLVCDNSTIGPTRARQIHRQLRARGIGYVECPMLGGAGEARAGSLFLVISGEPADIERVLPLARLAAREHRIVGGPGEASLFKTVQNGLGHVQATAIAEALALVAAAGGDVDRFIEVVGAGGGMAATNLFRAKAPMMRDPDLPTAGTLYIAAKDAGLAAALAAELGHAAPLFARAAAVYRAALASGLQHHDMAAIARVVEAETGARIAKD